MQINATQLTYWQQQLENAPTMLTLPADKQRQGAANPQTAVLNSQLPAETAPSTTHLLAAYTLLLLRHSQQEEVVVGTAVAHQLLPLRVTITPHTTFAQLVEQLTEAYQQAQAHALPLAALIDGLQLTNDGSYAPLFQAVFAESCLPESAYADLYDLTLVVTPVADGWQCAWHYRADLFTKAHLEQFATHLETLLHAATHNPSCPAAELTMMPAEETLLRHTWNQTALPVPHHLCLPEWIAQQAAKTPERTAVSDTHTRLTYAELDRQSGQLAAYLRQQGVQPGIVVALAQERTVSVLVTLLGILKAGGTYLPLTAELPTERIAFMLDDAQAALLLTESHLSPGLPNHVPHVRLDDQSAEIASLEPLADFHYDPTTTAYIIYTSGSTGVPKGVPISHRNIVNLTAAMLQEPGMTAADKFLAVTSLSFDILGYELYTPLVVGAEVVIASTKMIQDGHRLSERLAMGDITFLQGTPITWQMLLAAGWPGTPGLKMISCGEALTRHLATQLLARGQALWNLYGPTEATIFATGHRVLPEELAQLHRDDLPIGRPIHNMQAYILDTQQRLLPIGAVGELYLGGAGLSHGYLHRAELTAERFIRHPFSDDPDARLYRTGDLARYRHDGVIEYLGRTDYQVKVHGFRIELGEIESRLEELPEVQTAVATVWTNPANSNQQLVAYFVAASGEPVTADLLRAALKTRLPGYMIPSILMQLPQLPATPNGKVDRKALPTPQETPNGERPYTAPRTPLEEQLAGLWAELLSLDRIGIQDSFLDLGGHSLLATHLVSEMQTALGVYLSVGDIFRHETIAELAAFVTNIGPDAAAETVITAVEDHKKHALSPAQQRLWFFYKLDPQSPAYTEPIAIHLRGPVNVTWLQQSLTDMVTRHEVLRTVYMEETEVYGRVQPIDQLPLPILDLRHLPAAEQETAVTHHVVEEDERPFDLTREIPIRTTLLHLGEAHWVLLLTLHHIAMDLWSIELIIQEITTFYRAYQAGHTPDLPPLPIQYSDYAAWQKTWLADHEAGQLAYWKQTLAPDPEPLRLLTDKPRGDAAHNEGANFTFQLSDPVVAQTLQFMQKERVTLFMLLLAAYHALMHRYTQQAEINVGVPFANRHQNHTEKLIGFFTNTIVINATVNPDTTFRQLLGQVWERVLGAQDHQDLPFNKVVEAIQTTRRDQVSPLFQTFFTVQAIEGRPQIPGVEIEPVAFESKKAKFDLMLSIAKQGKQINGFVEYSTALFTPARIQLLGEHYVNLLANLMQQPDTPIREIDFRTEGERMQQSQAAHTAVSPQPLIAHFADTAARFASKTAVTSPQTSLTYHQLHYASNQIAHLLLAHHIQPGDVVAVLAAPTPLTVATVLGILKIGAVYLPLNEEDPAPWQQAALLQSQAKLLLYSQSSPASGLTGLPQLAIETAQGQARDELPTPTVGGLYLPMFGPFPAAELARLAELYPTQPASQVVQFAPFASHQAAHELFATLLNGGTLHLAAREQLTKLSTIYELLNNQRIDFAILPAALIAAVDPKKVPQLQTIVSLEADMDPTHWQKWAGRQWWHGHLTGASLLPTVLSAIVTPETWVSGTAVSPTTLLDAQGQPTPVGVLGTLHLGQNQPPTHDQFCWLPDGRLQFRHYHPTHTTTRGRYLSTEAIAAVLQQHPAVQKCIVLPDQNPCEKRLLNAFIIPAGALDTEQLAQFAQAQLPAPFVPAQFQTIARLPLTAVGQVDYQALQTMQQQETQQDQQADSRATKRSELAERRKNLSAKQQALLNKWQQKKQEENSQPLIPKLAAGQKLPLSFAQRRLLVLDHLDPNKATYNVPLALQIDGRLNETVLQQALDTLYVRHSSLRTTFFYGDDEQPYQHIAEATHLPINQVDFSAINPEEREAAAQAWVMAEVQRPFSLTTGPLIRVCHLRLAETQHLLVIVMHHIITDGWSMNIFIREFLQLYATQVQGAAGNLPEMPIDYSDFAAWQQQWLQGETLAQQVAYWKEQLNGAPAVITLPTDLPRPKMQSTHGRTYSQLLPTTFTTALNDLSQANSSTLFMTLFAAYNVLLARYSQQDDLVVGTPIANRNQPGIENLIGFFVNMLPLRTQLNGEDTFTTLLARVRQTALDAYNHQDIPFEQVVNSLQPDRDTSYTPVFQVAFALRNNENMELPALNGLKLTPLSTDNNTAKYDLTLVITETNSGLLCSWEYCTDLFFDDTIQRLHTHFATLLQSIVQEPSRPVKRLDILPEAEKQRLLHEWQGTVDNTIPQICLHQQFELWAEQQPAVTAVTDPHLTLTYQQLNQRANQLARLLINQGVRPGDAVGIHMTASTPAIVIIMACHKARAAYVPFDPTYPTQRLQLMLDDTAAPVVLTDSSLEHLDTGRCAVWHWEAIQPRLAEQPNTNLNLDYTPTDPAYIIYTSGSTGKPKGVICGHTGVFNMQRAFNDWGHLPPQAIFSLWTSLNFDASVYEIFPAFITGGSLTIVPQEIRSDALALFNWLAENNVHHSYLPPFMVEPFYKWLQEAPHSCAMRRLMVGVEPLAEQTLVGIQKLIPGLAIINAYGPTEATVISTVYRVPPDSTRQGNAPIGRALPNYQVYLLDEFMQPVPIGVAGELYVGGIGLAQGYLNRPELTAEKFIPNPFASDPQARLYRTGDLARYLADGHIMFIGRTDFQLKVRGFRVELGEIESNLLAQPGVATAVVLPYTAADGQTALVAYFTVEPGANPAPDQQTLHSALSQTLPNYMVPAIWVPLETMPRTPNDKIDRNALPAPGLEERERTLPFVAPRTAVEKQLHTIWQSLLNLAEISIHDSFFQLGGHSLLATQLVSRLQKQFNVKLQLRDVFEHSTIAQIARLVELAQTAVPPTNAFSPNGTRSLRQQHIPPVTSEQPPLSFAQRRLLVMDQLDPNQATYNIPLAFAVNGRLDETALQTAADQLAARHQSLRTTFPTAESGEPYQHIAAAAHLPITPIDFTAQPAAARQAEARAWIEMEAQRPFNLSTGPLVRLSHLRLSDSEHILVIVMHHIITDGWSMTIFVREFISLYLAQVQGAAAKLPEMRVQYADFAAWQQGWLQGDGLKQQLNYWQTHLANAPAVLTLPTDLPRPKLQGTHGRILTHQLSPELSAALLQLSQAHNSTLFMTLFAAYNVLLARLSQQDDIVVGTPIANRNHPEIENIIGFFVNMLPLRTQINPQASFTDLLAQVRQIALEAYNHQDIPFEQVVNLLQPVRDTSHAPIFQVSFALVNAPPALPQLNELRFTPLTAESQTSKYDLTLGMTETNNGLICTWEYSTDLFFAESIERLHRRFETLLQAIVAAPQQAVARLPLLPDAEKQLLLHDWQGTPDTTLPQIGLHQQFEQWVTVQPEVTAVADPSQTLTYQQLNQRANQLARLLIQHGVQPGSAVGIHMSASVPAILAILACHKARAAYVPFDPAYPTQRLQYMLDDTAAPVILTASSLEHLDTGRCTIWTWPDLQARLDQQPGENLNLPFAPTDPAYIIYTSGSTGQPKGVICGHPGVFNLLRAFDPWGQLPPQAVGTLWTSLNFDVSVYEIFATLLSGGQLHIVPAEIRTDAPQLFAWLASLPAASVYLPPFLVEPLAAWLKEDHEFTGLQRLLVGVEPLAEPTLVQIQRHIPGLTLLNGYGPTEATVCATLYPVSPASSRKGNAPIGRPLQNTQVYLLDAAMQPVPLGTPGELYIGGAGLAFGYLNQPELTADRFVPHPFTSDPTARLYRTGDLVRHLPDGNLMFVGRTDFQLKVRGFRIELGEIEAQLLAQPGVVSGVVMPHTAPDGQITLVAYFTLDDTTETDQPTLREGLSQRLPAYMVPSVWMQLDEMPRTPNDKIDRNALPQPNLADMQRNLPFTAPTTIAEEQLLHLWQTLLGTAEISIHDNFFELGGHSLLATQLVSQIQRRFRIKLPLREVFEQGTIAQLARLVETSQAQTETAVVPLTDSSKQVPVSFAQQRLLVLDQLDPNQATFNIPMAFQIDGRLDEAALQTAVDTLYQRHGSLRTSFFYAANGQPYQHIADENHLPVTTVDFATRPEAVRENEARAWVQAEAQRPFALNTGPLIRVSHLRLAETQHLLVIVMHHIITDGWSMSIFVREFVQLYIALVQNRPARLPEMPIQYTDFAVWQHKWLQGDVLSQQLAYWQNHLADAPLVLNLPTDLPRPKLQSTRGSLHVQQLSPEISQALSQFSQKQNSTLFMTLFAAYNLLLYRYSHQDDIVVGVPIANRNQPGIEGLIGFFVNMLPLRTRIGQQIDFTALLAQVRQTVLEAFSHQDIPFEQVVSLLQPVRETSYSPIFQVSFTLQNSANTTLPPLAGLKLTPLETESKTAKYDLTLVVTETNSGLLCTWEYGTDLFFPETIERLHTHFETLLHSIVQRPDQPVQQLPLLPEAEKQLLLHNWQGAVDDTIPKIGLHQQFEQWVAVQPEVTAVSDPSQTLTYQQLNQRANQLARLFRQQGVQPGSAIGIHMAGGVPAIVTIMACHKARAAYVPFDPAYPTQRLQFMLEDTAAPVILTDSSLEHLQTGRCAVWHWDELQPLLDEQPDTNINLAYQPNDPAYIIYTSGSTGQPKGVVCGHTGVFNMQRSFDQWGTLPPQAIYSLWTSLNFDASVYEIFPAFITGGSLAIVPLDIRADAPRLFAWLAEKKIQHSYLPPFMVEPLLKWVKQTNHHLALLRLMVGVEPLAEPTLAEIQRLVPGLTLINAYGPTEATVCSTHYRVPPDSRRTGNAPIGKALLNFQVYLLDEELQPVPIGVAGELYVGGIGLAHGYHNRPELTAERFVPNPFVADPEARLYRTGDLARYLPDGNIMFIGRTDFQLKVRGFRIELGEIETHLLAQPGVAAGVVMPHTAADGLISLVAYYTTTPDADPAPDAQMLRDALHNALPNYMVPSIWMPLEKMPRTPNDKIDRKALPEPNLDEMVRAAAYAPPTTLLEKQLVVLWQELLQVSQIGIHDSFFSLGGHSLLAMQMIAALRQQLNKEIPLRLLFDAPTIAELAHDLQRLEDQVMERIPLRPFTDHLPLSFAQQRLWFLEQLNPQANASYNVPIHLSIAGPLDLNALTYSFNQLLARHESLRTRYRVGADETPYQEIVPYTAVALPLTDLSHLPPAEKEAQAQRLRAENATTPFDLHNGPIFRIHILRLAPDLHQLLFTIHHIAFDAWSTGLFLREIVAHYLHQTTGQPLTLPKLAVQYADFALWQQQRLTPEVMAEQLAFWRTHLADATPSLALPFDKPRPQWQTFNGEFYEFSLPTAVADQVKQWAQTNQATQFMALLTAFYGLLYRYAHQEDIVVGTPIANRSHPDLKNVIGFFLNTLALRANLDDTTTWHDLLRQTRQTMVDAQDYQEYPFENLVQALLPDRDPSRHPLFQVMFVLNNQADTGQLPANLPIQLNPIVESTHTAKFDLLLDMQETAAGFTASFEYNTDLFFPATIARMAEHFQQIVAAMVTNPDQPIAEAQLLTPQEQAQIAAWNDTAVPIDPHELVHHRFERQADATPQAVAVLFGTQQLGNQQLTYAELEAKANQLAHFLQANGVQPNDQVGLMIPRSLEMVTAVLAILKAGAGYVPLDPDYPPDRIQLMLDHADAKLLLTHSSLDQSDVGRSRTNVDELDLSAFSEERVTAVIDPEHTVYVIFTSGSTGTPKGVVLPHRALNNMLAWQKKAMYRQGPTRTLQFTSLSFDVHFQEMFSTWQAGGTLVLIPDDVRRDGEQLLAYLQKYRIERLFLPFVALHNLAEAAHWLDSYPDTLQEVITAGEALQATPPIRDFFKRLPGCAFHNHYGPSESHVITAYTLGPDPDQWPDLPPIGTVIDNNKIHLLDANMRPVPIGVPGELYIEGVNLATGYINQPQLTAERFIPLPVIGNPLSVNGKRSSGNRSPLTDYRLSITVYRTGDLARYLPDGSIQYLGRNDFQVKIRGHRVELGEIETVLNQHPAVQQAVVQAHKPDQGAQQLVAYVKTADETAVAHLSTLLHEKLPAYMVPAHFIRLEQFPLTPSGKINRRALPAPENIETVRLTPYAAPETPLQQQLVEVWERVLNIAPVGIYDNFFELGGHSLLAIRLVAAMQKATAVKLPLPRLFQEGTIAAIARYMSDPTAQTAHSPVVPLRPGKADQPPLIVIHPGSGQVLPYLGLVQALPAGQPVYGLQSMGLLPDTPAQTDIASMAASYLQALAAADIPQPYHLLGWSMGGVVAVEIAQQLAAAGQSVGSLMLIDTFAPSGTYDKPSATTLLQWFARDTGYLSPKKRPNLLPDHASIGDQLRHLWPQLQAAGSLPEELTWEAFEQQFTVFQANYAAMQAYAPRPFSQPVQLIVAKNSAKGQKDKALGWQAHLAQLSVDVLRGNHFTLLQEPKTVNQIAQTVTNRLGQPARMRP